MKKENRFTRKTLDSLLEEIRDVYFEDDYQGGLWEAIEHVKGLYSDEINSLERY